MLKNLNFKKPLNFFHSYNALKPVKSYKIFNLFTYFHWNSLMTRDHVYIKLLILLCVANKAPASGSNNFTLIDVISH